MIPCRTAAAPSSVSPRAPSAPVCFLLLHAASTSQTNAKNSAPRNLAARSPLDGVPRRLGKWMLDEGQWASITNYLGLCVFALLVAFLFVTADHAEVRVSQAVRLLFLAGKCHCAERLTLLGGKQAKKD